MKKITFLWFAVFLVGHSLFAQSVFDKEAMQQLHQRGEIYLSVNLNKTDKPLDALLQLEKTLYIDKMGKDSLTAYANKQQFNNFLKLGIPYRLLTPPSMLFPREVMDTRPQRTVLEWNYYPTYDQYVDLMNDFADNYPNLCELVTIGQTVQGRDLLFIHINDSLGIDRDEPELMYTATMHGDETTPYVLMLHLIDYLLSNYGTNQKVTDLINNTDLWINPLANPDGTYAGGNNTVYGATRTNGNGIDLNRNYPDPDEGPHPDGNEYQPETVAFMNFADEHDFVLSCNMHTGAEVANYPWDTWSRAHADTDWWEYVCRQYADTVHAHAPAGYFTDLNNGVTNGYAWYSISGGRQDYMNYFKHCREFTLELSHTKTPPPSQLPDFWEYNYRSFLNYMEQSLYGVRGIITNAYNGNPVKAKVFVENHDVDNSHVYASLPLGNYHRPIKSGLYRFTFSAFGYYPQTIDNVQATDLNTTLLNVQLHPMGVTVADFTVSDSLITPGTSVNFYDNSYSDSIASWQWDFSGGDPAVSTQQNPQGITYNAAGEYDVSLTISDTGGVSATEVKQHFIKVINGMNMATDTVQTCQTLFFDDGGEAHNYSNNSDFILTFVPDAPNSVIRVSFVQFALQPSLQCQKDFLSVYDGSDTTASLIGTYCGTEIPQEFVGQNNGNLTFYFHSDDSITDTGWKAWVHCDTNVGILNKPALSVRVFPNPAADGVTIESEYLIQWVAMYHLNGMCMLKQKVNGNKAELNLKPIPAGLYLLKIDGKNGTVVKKLMINGWN